jgi:class 3 adenylate cyclase
VEATSIDVIAAALQQDDGSRAFELSSPDGALTLLLCEIADMAAVRASLEPASLGGLLADQRAIVHAIAGAHNAEITRSHEDGFMITFDSAHAGVRCAIELQQSFASATALQSRAQLSMRIGLHTGFVIGEGENLFGRNVLLAARIATQAQAGEILASAKVREYTRTDPRFHFSARGEHHFKGLHGEHELFAVDWQPSAEGDPEGKRALS